MKTPQVPVAQRYEELAELYRSMSNLAGDIAASIETIETHKREMAQCVDALSGYMEELGRLYDRRSLTVRYEKEEVAPLDTQSPHE